MCERQRAITPIGAVDGRQRQEGINNEQMGINGTRIGKMREEKVGIS